MADQTLSNEVLIQFSNGLADAVERAGAATVQVNARDRFQATGVAYAADLVLTADHVIEREERILVGLPDGREVPATLVGRDPGSDLAVLRLREARLTPAELAPGEARVGQFVLSLGRPTLDGIQASLGIVSAVGGPVRTQRGGLLERYIRTDAVAYPGFSGGPLIDALGRVVGINTSGLAMGISLTIPVEQARRLAETLAQHGRIRRGYLGIRSQPVVIPPQQRQALGRDQESGLLLMWIEDNSPAARAGLMVGDILTALDSQPVANPDDLQGRLLSLGVGQTVRIEVLRGGRPETLTATVGERRG